MPADPALATAATPAATVSSSKPLSPHSQPHPHLQLHPHHHYPSPQSLYPNQAPFAIPVPHPQFTKPHDPSRRFVYPFSSSAGGFIPKGVPLANPNGAGYPPPSFVYSHGVRAMASPHLDYLNHPLHVSRPTNLQYPHMGSPVTAVSGPVKGVPVPVSTHPKAASQSAVSNSNGYKDGIIRQRSRDVTFSVIRDRKVRITDDASLYALCRSWLRNGINEESQPQQKDVKKALPKPLPASVMASYISIKKEDEKDEDVLQENEKSVEHLSPQDLLKRHIKRAKRVRARLREERLRHITRYRSRLRLLLPPSVEQLRNDTAAGNWSC